MKLNLLFLIISCISCLHSHQSTWISVLLKEMECLYHQQVQSQSLPSVGLSLLNCHVQNWNSLSWYNQHLLKIPRSPSKLKDLLFCMFCKCYITWMNNNHLPTSFFRILSEKQQIKIQWPKALPIIIKYKTF